MPQVADARNAICKTIAARAAKPLAFRIQLCRNSGEGRSVRCNRATSRFSRAPS
jgi:hypothetical protein